MRIIYGDITDIKADAIVNAANGVGFMGGWIGRIFKLKGVAESIHYRTRGLVEYEAKKASKKIKWLPRFLCGHYPGELYITSAGNLNATYIIHAVTMLYPGMKSSLKTVEKLIPNIIKKARELNLKSISIPLLGTGTGKLNNGEILQLYKQEFGDIEDMDIKIILYQN